MAHQGNPHICPECKTPQVGDSPFCESCGYRLRTQETALEGLPAISPEQLQRASVQRRTHTQEEPAITPAQARAHAQSRAVPSRTFVEGLPAISPKAKPEPPKPEAVHVAEQEASTEPAPLEASERKALPPAENSGLMPMAPPPPSALSWLTPLIGGLMLGGIIGTAFTWLAQPSSLLNDSNAHTQAEPQALKKLAFPQGTFTRGLDEPTRARMLRLCYKISDNSDKDCEQETLLTDEYPQIKQEVSGFMLDSVEATNARYTRCVDSGSCTPADLKACQVHTPQGLQISLRVPKLMLSDSHPVVCITHAQAREFCTWSSGRLPSHDEWEYAARGSRDARLFPWGDSWDPTFANWGERDMTRTAIAGKIDGEAWTAPGGIFTDGESPFGVHDMAGNVAEWVDHDATTPQARGGSWISPAYDLRVTKRFSHETTTQRTDVGVRCAYD